MIFLLGIVCGAVALLGWWMSRHVDFHCLTRGEENEHRSAEIVAFPPDVLCHLSPDAFDELYRIARRDRISAGDAASILLQECLVDDQQSTSNGDAA